MSKDDASAVVSELRQLRATFDEMPFVVPCAGDGCHRRAERASINSRNASVQFWCAACRPIDGRYVGEVSIVRTYSDALRQVLERRPKTAMGFQCFVIGQMAVAKGIERPWRGRRLTTIFEAARSTTANRSSSEFPPHPQREV